MHGPRGTAQRVADLASATVTAVQARFAFADLEPGTMEIGPFQVTVAHMNHPVETFGFRVEHAGRVLAYSADTGTCPALVGLARFALEHRRRDWPDTPVLCCAEPILPGDREVIERAKVFADEAKK